MQADSYPFNLLCRSIIYQKVFQLLSQLPNFRLAIVSDGSLNPLKTLAQLLDSTMLPFGTYKAGLGSIPFGWLCPATPSVGLEAIWLGSLT